MVVPPIFGCRIDFNIVVWFSKAMCRLSGDVTFFWKDTYPTTLQQHVDSVSACLLCAVSCWAIPTPSHQPERWWPLWRFPGTLHPPIHLLFPDVSCVALDLVLGASTVVFSWDSEAVGGREGLLTSSFLCVVQLCSLDGECSSMLLPEVRAVGLGSSENAPVIYMSSSVVTVSILLPRLMGNC